MPNQEPEEPAPSPIFEIDIADLLSDFMGASDSYEFEEEISSDLFTHIILISPLVMSFETIRTQYGIEIRIKHLECTIDIPDDDIRNKPIYLHDISREFHLQPRDDHPDDIEYIDKQKQIINIQNLLEQEIMISALI